MPRLAITPAERQRRIAAIKEKARPPIEAVPPTAAEPPEPWLTMPQVVEKCAEYGFPELSYLSIMKRLSNARTYGTDAPPVKYFGRRPKARWSEVKLWLDNSMTETSNILAAG